MRAAYRSNKAFSLVEVLVAVGVLATAIVAVFRSYATVLSAVGFSRNMTQACLLSEEKLGEARSRYTAFGEVSGSGSRVLRNTKFNWKYEIKDADTPELKQLHLTVSWKENTRKKEYPLEFTLFLPSA
jgi:type II secretion system protein I